MPSVGVIGFIKIALTYSTSELCESPPTPQTLVKPVDSSANPVSYSDSFSLIAIWSAVQMVVSLLCCCLPVFNSLLPGHTPHFWSRLTSKLASSRQRATAYFMKGSTKESGGVANSSEMSGPYDSFEQHSDDVEWSSKDLQVVCPQPSYHNHTKAYTFSHYPIQMGPQQEPTGIHVQRRFDMA